NASYLPIGAEGEKRLTVQTEQDAHAARLGVLNDRIETKVGRFYENGGWDLVDAARRPGFDRAAWDDAELPASVRGLDQEALLDLLGAKAAERDAVKARIRELVEQRDAFLRGDGKEGAPAPKPDALRSIIAGQAEAKGFRRAGS
ncbi:MAG: hypothetical protein OER88_12135, partial [Planctomycetota bacterium]|nr:hypothetical protein [Planctomycetota bacterium]